MCRNKSKSLLIFLLINGLLNVGCNLCQTTVHVTRTLKGVNFQTIIQKIVLATTKAKGWQTDRKTNTDRHRQSETDRGKDKDRQTQNDRVCDMDRQTDRHTDGEHTDLIL